MIVRTEKGKKLVKKIVVATVALLLIGMAATWYIFNDRFVNTAEVKPEYTVSALAFINEFKINDSLNPAANKKYADKIVEVKGRITEVEAADTTINLKITNADGAYILFAFQQEDQAAAKKIKAGDSVSIKGSCNGASFSEILGVPFITFKRCSLNK